MCENCAALGTTAGWILMVLLKRGKLVSREGGYWAFRFPHDIHDLKRRPDYMYFSLGGREAKTRNPVLSTV